MMKFQLSMVSFQLEQIQTGELSHKVHRAGYDKTCSDYLCQAAREKLRGPVTKGSKEAQLGLAESPVI
jgi:hypothetical protein